MIQKLTQKEISLCCGAYIQTYGLLEATYGGFTTGMAAGCLCNTHISLPEHMATVVGVAAGAITAFYLYGMKFDLNDDTDNENNSYWD